MQQEQQTGTSEQENDHSDIGIKISPAEEIYESNRDMKSDPSNKNAENNMEFDSVPLDVIVQHNSDRDTKRPTRKLKKCSYRKKRGEITMMDTGITTDQVLQQSHFSSILIQQIFKLTRFFLMQQEEQSNSLEQENDQSISQINLIPTEENSESKNKVNNIPLHGDDRPTLYRSSRIRRIPARYKSQVYENLCNIDNLSFITMVN